MDGETDNSLTIDVEIDDTDCQDFATESSKSKASKEKLSLEHFNDPPPSVAQVRPHVGSNLLIKHLPSAASQQLEIYLNLPSFGSLFNWEYIASRLGLSGHKIMSIKLERNPTLACLDYICDRKISELVNALCDLNRIDVLISLYPFINNIKDSSKVPNHLRREVDSGVQQDGSLISQVSNSKFSSFGSADDVAFNLSLGSKYIFINHHEDDDNSDLIKNFKWLLKNLRKHGASANVSVVDVDDLLRIDDSFSAVHSAYEKASQLLCVFSMDLADIIHSQSRSKVAVVKKYVCSMMNAEYVRECAINRRFRGVIFDASTCCIYMRAVEISSCDTWY